MILLQLWALIGLAFGGHHIKDLPILSFHLEVGTVYEEALPLYFDGFQHTRLLAAKNAADKSHQVSSICSIQQAQPGLLTHLSNVSYSNSTTGLVTPSMRDRTIISFDKLRSLEVLIDSIQESFVLISLFVGNKVTYHHIDPKSGELSYLNSFVIETAYSLSHGKLFNAGGTRMGLVTKDAVFELTVEGALEIKGFHQMKGEVLDVAFENDRLYLAWGELGVSISEWKPQ